VGFKQAGRARQKFGISLLTCVYTEVSLGFRVTGMDMTFFMPVFILPVDMKSNPYPYLRVKNGIHIRTHGVGYPQVRG
jgi:hypothetical protein